MASLPQLEASGKHASYVCECNENFQETVSTVGLDCSGTGALRDHPEGRNGTLRDHFEGRNGTLRDHYVGCLHSKIQ